MPRTALVPAAVALLAIGSGPTPARPPAMPQEPNLEPGHTLLARVAEAYKALPGYADEGAVTLSFSRAGEDETQVIPRPFAFARPNRLAVSFEPAAFVIDGKEQVSALAGLYLVSDAPEALNDRVLARDPAAAYIFGGVSGIPSMTLFRLLASDDPYRAILQGVERLEREPERTVGGVECRSLKVVPEAGPVVRLLIDPQSSLIRRIEVVPETEELPQDLVVKEISWSPGTITTGIPPDARFAFTPPADARRVESLSALMAGPDGEDPAAALLGKPAPDFTLDLLAPDGAIERVSRADLAGKVVLIDAWATWCVPCVPELQAVEVLLDRFGSGPDADRLRVISLSIDTPPPGVEDPEPDDEGRDDPTAEVRELVETFLDGRGLRLDRPPLARVAIDPKGEATEAIGIQALPMLILIDPEGVVRAVHVAAPSRVVRELATTIDALLDAPALGDGAGGRLE